MPNAVDGIGKRRGKATSAITISFQEVKRDPLCGLLADTRHTTKTVDQPNQ
jgi:hypothetical protein